MIERFIEKVEELKAEKAELEARIAKIDAKVEVFGEVIDMMTVEETATDETVGAIV